MVRLTPKFTGHCKVNQFDIEIPLHVYYKVLVVKRNPMLVNPNNNTGPFYCPAIKLKNPSLRARKSGVQ